jgi:hypothetical protein
MGTLEFARARRCGSVDDSSRGIELSLSFLEGPVQKKYPETESL